METLKTKIVSVVLRLNLNYGEPNITQIKGINDPTWRKACHHGRYRLAIGY